MPAGLAGERFQTVDEGCVGFQTVHGSSLDREFCSLDRQGPDLFRSRRAQPGERAGTRADEDKRSRGIAGFQPGNPKRYSVIDGPERIGSREDHFGSFAEGRPLHQKRQTLCSIGPARGEGMRPIDGLDIIEICEPCDKVPQVAGVEGS